MKNLLIATKNRGKIEEFRRIIEEFGGQIDLKSTLDFPHLVDVEETGSTELAESLVRLVHHKMIVTPSIVKVEHKWDIPIH